MTVAWLIAATALAIGILLIRSGKASRRAHGLSDARTIDLDRRTLFSERLMLTGRPDRVTVDLIPEEWKSSARVFDSHRAQLGTYFILIEEETGFRPPHGFVTTGDDARHLIENTEKLRAWVLAVADKVRAMRRQPHIPIPVRQPPAKCAGCGMRENCAQRSDRGQL